MCVLACAVAVGTSGWVLGGGGFGLDLAAGGCVLQGVGGWLGKINCDDIYFSFASRVTGGRSQRTHSLLADCRYSVQGEHNLRCVCGCPSFPLSLPWWSCGGGRRRRRVAVVIAVVIVVVVVKSCSPRERRAAHDLLALDELVSARGDSPVVQRW